MNLLAVTAEERNTSTELALHGTGTRLSRTRLGFTAACGWLVQTRVQPQAAKPRSVSRSCFEQGCVH
jgi:hypothetical protein